MAAAPHFRGVPSAHRGHRRDADARARSQRQARSRAPRDAQPSSAEGLRVYWKRARPCQGPYVFPGGRADGLLSRRGGALCAGQSDAAGGHHQRRCRRTRSPWPATHLGTRDRPGLHFKCLWSRLAQEHNGEHGDTASSVGRRRDDGPSELISLCRRYAALWGARLNRGTLLVVAKREGRGVQSKAPRSDRSSAACRTDRARWVRVHTGPP